MSAGRPDELDLVEQRLDFLELLDTPHEKGEIVDALDHSRSTVDRAVRSLVDAGFLTETDDGYATTVTGRLATERYRQFRREQRAILDAREVLGGLPHDCDLPASLLAGAGDAAETDPQLFERVAESLAGAERYTAVLPVVADPRHLRLLRSRTERTGLTASLLAPTAVLERVRAEFPALAVDLAETPDAGVVATDVPPYGLVLVEDAEGATLLVVAYEGDEPAGLIETTDERAVAWARQELRQLRGEGTDATDLLRDVDAGDDVATMAAGDRLSPRLRAEGFVRVDDDYFDDRTALDPATGWRAGLALPEVAAGYAVERETDEGEPLSATLSRRLRGGTDLAVLGPPGSGKSTVCRQVAYRWFDAGHGPVYYREGGAGRSVESVEALVATVEASSGRPLVVVEDAVRADAAAVFEVIERLGDREDACFLVDARESEWHDPEAAVDRSVVETVTPPPIGAAECRRIADRVEGIADVTIDRSGEQLLADVRDRGNPTAHGGTDEETDRETVPVAGDAFLLFDRLARYADPLAGYDGPAPTTLDEDVDALRERLADASPVGVEVGLLCNALNAAGRRVDPALAYALVGHDVDRRETSDRASGEAASHEADRREASTRASGEERPASHEPDRREGPDIADIESALEVLEGWVLFPDGEGYRTVHGAWSVRFLERAADALGAGAARERFERAVTALLSLPDDPERRERVRERSKAAVPADGQWAGDTATALFRLGADYPKLAPLFGDGADTLSLPAGVPASARLRCRQYRGRMLLGAGAAEDAMVAFERLAGGAGDDPDATDRWRFESLLGQCAAARYRGDPEAAEDAAAEALGLADRLDDSEAVAEGRIAAARVAESRSDYDDALDHLDAALSAAREAGATDVVADVLATRGTVAQHRSDHDAAATDFEEALSSYESLGDLRGQARVLEKRGRLAHDRGNAEKATDCYRRALERARETGDRARQARVFRELGNVAYDIRRDVDDARSYYERGVDLAEAVGDDRSLGSLYSNLGNVAEHDGETERAIEYYRRALEIDERLDNDQRQAGKHVGLSMLTHLNGDIEAAREHAEQALSLARSVGATRITLQAQYCQGVIEMYAGDLDAARERVAEAVERADEIDNSVMRADLRQFLGDVLVRQGALERAEATVERAHEIDREMGREEGGHEALGRVALARGAPEAAADHFEQARSYYRTYDDPKGQARMDVCLARAARRRGEYEAAADRLDDAAAVIEANEYPLARPMVLCERGALARERGALDEAGTVLDRAREAAEAVDHTLLIARCRLERGRLARQRGDDDAAREHFEAALETYEDAGATRLAAVAVEELLATAEASDDPTATERWRQRRRDLAQD